MRLEDRIHQIHAAKDIPALKAQYETHVSAVAGDDVAVWAIKEAAAWAKIALLPISEASK